MILTGQKVRENYMVIITKYRQVKDGSKTYIRSEESSICPICSSGLRVIGSRDRKIIGIDGQWQTYVIRRLQCTQCKHIHHELPDLLVPYKRHCAETIVQVAIGDEPPGTVKQPTIHRIRDWWQDISQYLHGVALALEVKFDIHFSSPLQPIEIVRAVVNQHLWIQTRSVYSPIWRRKWLKISPSQMCQTARISKCTYHLHQQESSCIHMRLLASF